MKESEARSLIQPIADRVAEAVGEPVSFFPDWHYEDDEFFAFNYNSERFIETREPGAALVGHGPVIVERATSRVIETGSAFSLDENLDSLRQTGELKPLRAVDAGEPDWTSELCSRWLTDLAACPSIR